MPHLKFCCKCFKMTHLIDKNGLICHVLIFSHKGSSFLFIFWIGTVQWLWEMKVCLTIWIVFHKLYLVHPGFYKKKLCMCVCVCVCGSVTLEAEFGNCVSSVLVGADSPLTDGWIVWPPLIQHKRGFWLSTWG